MPVIRRTIAAPLAVCYLALVVYASLFPFTGWRSQGVVPWAYLSAPWPRYWTKFDLWTNLVGYIPLGFLVALAVARSGFRVRWAWYAGLLGPVLLSLTLEGVQSYLPMRVPSWVDALLNSVGGMLGAVAAMLLLRGRFITPWERFRAEWLVTEPAGGVAVLALWPAALLYPTPVPYGLGQAWEHLHAAIADLLRDSQFESWVPVREVVPSMGPLSEAMVVALGLLSPLWLGYALLRRRRQRLWFGVAWVCLFLGVGGLSAALTYGPEHAWDWFSPPIRLGMACAAVGAVLGGWLSHRGAAVALLLGLMGMLGLLNGAPESPYFAETLQEWGQGRFIHFHGLSQWLGWSWPYAALVVGVRLALRPPGEHYNPSA